MSGQELADFVQRQLAQWYDAAKRFDDLREQVVVRRLAMEGIGLSVQWNPARIVSTKAAVGGEKPIARPCFLCAENQVKEQFGLPYIGDTRILINPFPILPEHIVVAKTAHEPQTFATLAESLYQLASEVPEYVFFYNGARSGASAPDHAHYQGGRRGTLPLERDFAKIAPRLELLDTDTQGVELLRSTDYPAPLFIIRSRGRLEAHRQCVTRFLHTLPKEEGRTEADFNLFVWRDAEEFITVIAPRTKHRPDCFFQEGASQILVSPGAIDMAGLLITPREEDFQAMTAERMSGLLAEVGGVRTLTAHREPTLRVGILRNREIRVNFLTPYICQGRERIGMQIFRFHENAVAWEGATFPYLDFHSQGTNGKFLLEDVVIGVNFHWEQAEAQTFEGNLSILVEGEGLTAVNHIPTESYLASVISSEMSAHAPLEFLKAHAVVSRSWVIHQLRRRASLAAHNRPTITDAERIVWYDNENHLYYDICADDHCQRYQGLKHQGNAMVLQALRETVGEVLWSDGEVCDARFYKCCGGVTETFSTCWEEKDFTYLSPIADEREEIPSEIDLRTEEAARAWIMGERDSFCHTEDEALLAEVLNNFDRPTNDFYRWEVQLSQAALQRHLWEKARLRLGEILALTPIERGRGGRIKRLHIEGTERSIVVGKELEIRRLLSPSHLYSSAFVVTPTGKDAIPESFTLRGAGWGHGVGLCQIGAAAMVKEGYDYQTILKHYYRGATLQRLYE